MAEEERMFTIEGMSFYLLSFLLSQDFLRLLYHLTIFLLVSVIEGRDLVAMDSTGTSDPYVIVTVGGKEKRTKVIRFTLNPKWRIGSAGEKFKLYVFAVAFCRLKIRSKRIYCFASFACPALVGFHSFGPGGAFFVFS